jgi:hypothetical protein
LHPAKLNLSGWIPFRYHKIILSQQANLLRDKLAGEKIAALPGADLISERN